MTSTISPTNQNNPLPSRGISQEERTSRFGHHPACLWFTGLSGAGKSTLSLAYERILFDAGKNVHVIDGDIIRQGLSSNLGFSPEDREENIRRVGHLARILFDAGFIVICCFITPTRLQRSFVRSLFPPGTFRLVHIHCELEECINRDPKGLYKKALSGEIPDLTGIGAPYEDPQEPDILIDTTRSSISECLNQLPPASSWR